LPDSSSAEAGAEPAASAHKNNKKLFDNFRDDAGADRAPALANGEP
jgi:hypothetical protein